MNDCGTESAAGASAAKWFFISVLILILSFYGDPDLHDVLIDKLQGEECEQASQRD